MHIIINHTGECCDMQDAAALRAVSAGSARPANLREIMRHHGLVYRIPTNPATYGGNYETH